jgi:CRP-like cAMP-binding protein
MSEDLWIGQADDLADAPRPRRRRMRIKADAHIGCPLRWFRWVFSVAHGKNELAVAMCLYRLRTVRHSRTVKLSNERLLAEIGVDRFAKYRALRRLAEAGVITIRRSNRQTLEITFLGKARRKKL